MAVRAGRTPRWAWAVILVLAALQPFVHALIRVAPPADTVSTGLHIPDSALFLYSMDMFRTDFHSAYATCQSEYGEASVRYYGVPLLWLYGALGLVVGLLPGDAFLYYGLANGLGVLFYLWVVYRFLLLIAPAHAGPAFLLFAFSGGPGGLAYVLAGIAGWHGHPQFEAYFLRIGVYDLMEGPHFNPVLYAPRLYYTLSLGCCLGGLTAVIRALRDDGMRMPLAWCLAVLAGAFLNARFAAFSGGLLVLYLFCRWQGAPPRSLNRRDWTAVALFAVPALAGILAAGALGQLDPATLANLRSMGTMAMWFSPFVLVTWLHWIGAGAAIASIFRGGTQPVRIVAGVGVGYLAAYAAGYFLYQGYHGNLLLGRDGSVARVVSDPALLGGLAGGLVAWRWRPKMVGEQPKDGNVMQPWLVLWLLGYTALALSGFGQGWFLQFGPQRLQVFLWLPLCLLAAMGLATWPVRWRRGAYGVLIGCGVVSMTVAVFAFQSPMGRAGAEGRYPRLHAEIMHEGDAELIAAIGEGVVLAPPPASDVVVQQRGNPVVFGIGSFNLSDRPQAELEAEVETFFSPESSDAVRREIVARWCVDWVYCPRTWPVDGETLVQLKAAGWLRIIAENGDGLLLAVN